MTATKCDDCGTVRMLCTYTEGVLCDPCHNARVEKRIADFDGATQYTSEVICPHCGYQYSDSWEMDGDRYDCADCEREFFVEHDISVTYSTRKAPEL